MNKIISPIAIDMGAKNTGVYYAKYTAGSKFEEIDKQGEVLVYDKYTALLKDRTANRHARRGYQRRKLAKRLLVLVLENYFGFPAKDHHQAIGFLMNRRGFTILDKDYDENYLQRLPDDAWKELSDDVKEILKKENIDISQKLDDLAEADQAEIKKLCTAIKNIPSKINFENNKSEINTSLVFFDYVEKIKKACDIVADGKQVTDDDIKKKKDNKELSKTQKWVIERLNNPMLTADDGSQTNLIEQINNCTNVQKLIDALPDFEEKRKQWKAKKKENNESIWDFNLAKFEFNDKNSEGLKQGDAKTSLHHFCYAVYKIDNEMTSGARHRSKYFEEIKEDLDNMAIHPHQYLAKFSRAVANSQQLDMDKTPSFGLPYQ